VRFVCPSCAASNRVPDKCAGLTIICRRCKTQINVPDDAGRRSRSWIASPRWLAILTLELLSLVALVVVIVMLARRKPPGGLPIVEGAGGAPQLAVPGGPLRLEWESELQAADGHFRVDSANVLLVRGHRPRPLGQPEARDRPWTPELLEGDRPPALRPVVVSLTFVLPAGYTLSGQRVAVQAAVHVSFPTRSDSDGPLTVEQATLRREVPFVVATEAQGNAFDAWERQGTVLRWLAFACGALVIGIPVAAGAVAQQRVTIKCPDCGRTTEATFYHEGGEVFISPCPHRGHRPADRD